MFRRSKGYTIAQLLTVLAVIGVLAAILVPVAMMVRKRARSTVCLSQLHQIGLACALYQNDSEGQLPPDAIFDEPSFARFAWKALAPYVGSQAVFICPEAAPSDDRSVGYIYRAGPVRVTDKSRKFFGVEPGSVIAYCLDHTLKKLAEGPFSYTEYITDSRGRYQGQVNAVRLDGSAFRAAGASLEPWVYGTDERWYPAGEVPSGANSTVQTVRFPGEPWPPQFQL